MSYVDQGMSRGRMWAIVGVALLHALMAYAFVSGLAYKFVKGMTEDLKTFDVKDEPPPPPEEPPPPPPETQTAPPPMTVVNTPRVPCSRPSSRRYRRPSRRPSSRPRRLRRRRWRRRPRRRVIPPQRARANLNSYFSGDDYPAAALRGNDEGSTGFRLTIGPNGRVTDCQVTASSGSAALDQATCRILRSRARYTPARDTSGNPTSGTDSGRVTWRLPAD